MNNSAWCLEAFQRKAERTPDDIPGVLYGGGRNAELFTVSKKALTALCRSEISFRPGFITIDAKSIPCTIKEIQKDPLGNLVHVDLLNLKEAKSFSTYIDIHTVGVSPGVKRGGILNILVPRLEVKVSGIKLEDVPITLEVDMSKMNIGDVLHLKDLQLPKGVLPAHAARDNTILTVLAPSAGSEDSEDQEEKAE